MNNSFKRFLALLLAMIMVLPFFPTVEVYANLQNHSSNVRIQNIPNQSGGYTVLLEWVNSYYPVQRDPSTTLSDPNDADAIHRIDDFTVSMRNASLGESIYTPVGSVFKNTATGTEITSHEFGLPNVQAGSLYSLRVTPSHGHWYDVMTGNPPVPSQQYNTAPYNTATTQEEVLYMTDIVVNASGSGNSITVQWDNPTYDGVNVFKGYRIYYEAGGAQVTRFNHSQDVYIADATSVTDPNRPNVRRLQAVITDALTIVPGQTYAIKIEPFTETPTDLLRDRPAQSTDARRVQVGNRSLRISFTDREYRDNEASVALPLYVYEDGLNRIRLRWPMLSNLGTIVSIEIYGGSSDNPEDSSWRMLGELFAPEALSITNWPVDNPPDGVSYYQIFVNVAGMSKPIPSEIAIYDPTEVLVTPNRPTIFLQDTIKNNNSIALDIGWDAFIRQPNNRAEENQMVNGIFVDKDVTYDIWFTDSVDNLQDLAIPSMLRLEGVSPDIFNMIENPNTQTPGYEHVFRQYVARTGMGYQLQDIVANKVYYVKIVAHKTFTRRDINGNPIVYTSEPEIVVIYINLDGDISTPPMMSKPPLRVKTDENGNKIITQNSIDIEWTQSWYEVFDITQNKWFSKNAVVTSSGGITFLSDEELEQGMTVIKYHDAADIEYVKLRFTQAGIDIDNFQGIEGNQIQIRNIDMGDNAEYQLKVIPFSDLYNYTDYKEYIERLLEQEPGDGWRDIDVGNGSIMDYSVSGPMFTLLPNTTYVILFRAYRTMSDGRRIGYPTYVIATTLPEDTEIIITPVVPVLREAEPITDMEISVKWIEQPPLRYILSYSEIALKDPDDGTKKSMDDIEEFGLAKVEDGENYIYFTIDGLFPDTGYYVWIRSVFEGSNGTQMSGWSNSVFIKTKPLGKPSPPDSIGLAAVDNLKRINNEGDTNYTSSGKDYLILEWLKDANDKNVEETVDFTAEGDVEALFAPDIVGVYIAKFGSLISNKHYYVRGKTVVTVSREGDNGAIVKSYSYIIQVSPDSGFKDYIQIIIPSLDDVPENALDFIRMESEWSSVLIFRTNMSGDDYDGDVDPDLVPLPLQDFEIIYDSRTDTLTYRFRSNGTDSAGNKDNQVDQRFITTLLKNRVFAYELDLTRYIGKIVTNRTVEIPYSIISAFTERKITLYVRADNLLVAFVPGFLETAEVKGLSGYGANARVVLRLERASGDIPKLAMEYDRYIEEYVSMPHKISVQIVTPSRTLNLTELAQPMTIDLRLNNRYTVMDKNVGTFIANINTVGWERLANSYSQLRATMSIMSKKASSSYAVIAKQTPLIVTHDESRDSMISVTSRIDITDMRTYNSSTAISANQFNNLIAALVRGKMSVAINQPISNDDFTSLGKAKVLISGVSVSREAAFHSLVWLYEQKTKSQVKNYPSLLESSYSEISTASKEFQISLLKAEYLGFFDGKPVNPKGGMTIGEVMIILNYIIEDAGL